MADRDWEPEPDLTQNKVNENISISRGESQEIEIKFDILEDLCVRDEEDKEIKFCDMYRNQKTIVIFVRHFLCFMCKEYCDDLSEVSEESLQRAGVNLVVVGCAPSRFIKQFKELTGLKCPVYVDADRKIYKALGFLESSGAGSSQTSKHVKSWFFTGVLKSTWRAMWTREWQGDPHQQGGALIIGPGNIVHHTHIDQNSIDHAPINSLLQIAGVQQRNFDRDKPVLNL